jgi:thioredoxin-related protein
MRCIKEVKMKLKKKIFILLYVVLYFQFLQAQDNGIIFQKNIHWLDIVAKAKADNKYIFVDCFTTWCGPCKFMSKEIFTKKEVGQFYNKNFVNLHYQFDATVNDDSLVKFEYDDIGFLKKTYGVSSYPTYLFFNSNGELVHRDFGSIDEYEFIAKGINALNPQNQYYTQLKIYEEKKFETSFLRRLAMLALRSQDAVATAKFSKEYIALKPDIFKEKEDLIFMYETIRTTKDTGFNLIMRNLKQFQLVIDSQKLTTTLKTIIFQSEFATNYINWHKWDKIKWSNYSKNILKKYQLIGEEALFEIKVNAFQNEDYWTEYVNTIENFFTGHLISNEKMNEYAWTVFKYCNDPKILKAAIKWSKISFAHQTIFDPGFIDTYTNLLHKLGKSKDALKWELKAQKIAIESGANKEWGQDIINKMKNGDKTW